MNSDSIDPGDIYEGKVRYEYNNCLRRKDPKKIADQSCFNSRYTPDVNEKGLEAIQYIIDGLIENRDKTENQKNELLKLRESVTKMEQRKGNDLLLYIIKIMKDE